MEVVYTVDGVLKLTCFSYACGLALLFISEIPSIYSRVCSYFVQCNFPLVFSLESWIRKGSYKQTASQDLSARDSNKPTQVSRNLLYFPRIYVVHCHVLDLASLFKDKCWRG